MIDGHTHLEYGSLTKDYVLKFVEEAKIKGIKTLHILDHTHRFIEFEPMYEDLKKIPEQKAWLDNKEKKFRDHLDDFINLMQEIKKEDLPIEIKYGLEVCYTKESEAFLRDILSKYPFDFLIGSIHSIDGILYDMPFSKELLFDQIPIDTIYKRYYELQFDLIKSDLFTQIGHPDQIKLQKLYPSYDLTPTYTTLANLLNEHHMLCENNTGIHYRYHHPDIGLSDTFLQVMKDHHVSMITSSDAHHPEDVGCEINLIYEKTMR